MIDCLHSHTQITFKQSIIPKIINSLLRTEKKKKKTKFYVNEERIDSVATFRKGRCYLSHKSNIE